MVDERGEARELAARAGREPRAWRSFDGVLTKPFTGRLREAAELRHVSHVS